jgi:hypothetical protein
MALALTDLKIERTGANLFFCPVLSNGRAIIEDHQKSLENSSWSECAAISSEKVRSMKNLPAAPAGRPDHEPHRRRVWPGTRAVAASSNTAAAVFIGDD